MKNLWFINSCLLVIVLLCCSCTKHSFKKSVSTGISDRQIQSQFFKADSAVFFKTSIDTYGKSLSGILAVKQQHPDTLKVSFFTEMGVKFFDVMVYHDSYTIIDCIPQLNKPVIMNTLVEDIRWIVLWNVEKLREPVLLKSDKNEIFVRYTYNKDWIFASLSEDNVPSSITYAYGKGFKSKFDLSYQMYKDGLPSLIYVTHYTFDLKIVLSSVSFNE